MVAEAVSIILKPEDDVSIAKCTRSQKSARSVKSNARTLTNKLEKLTIYVEQREEHVEIISGGGLTTVK
jgi:hypothetical protein